MYKIKKLRLNQEEKLYFRRMRKWLLIFFVGVPLISFSNTQELDSLLNLLQSEKYDSNIIHLKHNIALKYNANSNPENAIKYENEAIELAKKTDDLLRESISHNSLGTIYWGLGDYDKAFESYTNAYNAAKKNNDIERESSYLGNMAMIKLLQSDYTGALEYLHKSLEIDEKRDDKRAIAKTQITIGTLFNEQQEYDKALTYFEKSLELATEINDKTQLANVYSNIGSSYHGKNNFDKALEYYIKAKVLEAELGSDYGLAGNLSNIGVVFTSKASETDDPNEKEKYLSFALENYSQALELARKNGYINVEAFIAYSIASIYVKQKKPKQARILLDSAIVLYTEMESYYHLNNAYLIRTRADSLAGDFKSAFEDHKKYKFWLDKVINEENKAELTKQTMLFDFEKKEAALKAEAEKQKALDEAEKKRQKMLLLISVAGILVITVVAFFIFRTLKLTQKQKGIIETAHTELEEKNQEILDSINYARRIQSAILPPNKVVKEYLQESFIIYKPKDIVAGDFYWLETKKDKVLFAVCDCTGHGVPGAMVSVVCNNGLNRSVREHKLTDPGKILNKTREIVVKEFEKSEEDVKDGMDIALCSLHGNTLQYAGANNPLWIIRKGSQEIEEIKADKQPIGKTENPKPYTTHTLSLEQGDTIYVFSDGYADQFGGEKGKKMKTVNFKKLLLSIQQEEMQRQKELIDKAFENWKGNLEQLDDVCVIGVRI